LSAAIQAELRAHQLLDETDLGRGSQLGILIEDFAVRPSSNATVFGYQLSSGIIEADVNLLSSEHEPLQHTRVEARASLARPVAAADDGFFRPLYRRFAQLTQRKLAGIAEPVAVNH
jgi:hypothetical protein